MARLGIRTRARSRKRLIAPLASRIPRLTGLTPSTTPRAQCARYGRDDPVLVFEGQIGEEREREQPEIGGFRHRQIAEAGADTFVAGSAIFGADDYASTIAAMRDELAAAGQ